IVTGPDVDEQKKQRLLARGVEIIAMPELGSGTSMQPMLETLYEKGITHLLVEGGASVNGSFLESGLVNKVMSFIAPKIVGGANAPTPIGGNGVSKMADAIELTDVTWETYGDDLCVIGYPKR
ncbi:MAG: RibD family protein, partial [Tumebacillaceae bacterium]